MVESRPLLEYLATAAAMLHTSHHPYYDVGPGWFAKIAADQPATVGQLRAFAGGAMQVWDHILGLAGQLGPTDDLSAFTDSLAAMDPEALRLELMGRRYRPVLRAVGIDRIEAAAAGNATAQRDFLRMTWPEEARWQTGLRQLLRRPAGETQEQAVAVLRALGPALAAYVDPILPILAAEAADRVEQAASVSPLELIRGAIDTAYVPSAEITSVLLAPSFVVRPFVDYIEYGEQMTFLYPVPARFLSSTGGEPPERLVRLAAALGDRGRLMILAALREREMTLKELGDSLSLPRSTLRHHIGVLRAAGLLRPMQADGGISAYQLREEAATDLAELVDGFLRGGPSPRPPAGRK